MTKNQGIIGEGVELTIEHLKDVRRSTVLFHLARHLLYNKYRDPGEEPKLHLFGQLSAGLPGDTATCLRAPTGGNHQAPNALPW